MNTGVKIHGHWKIVVRNPDGTVATRRDFENSLDLGGINLLPNLLAGGVTPGAWAIALGAQTAGNTGPCSGTTFQLYATSNVPASSSGNCFIGEPTGIYAATCASPLCSPNLSVTVLPFRIHRKSRNRCGLHVARRTAAHRFRDGYQRRND